MADSKFKNFQISDDVEDAVLIVYIAANISAIMSQVMRIEEAHRRRHSCWVRGYLRDRAEYGAYNRLMRDLKVHDNVKLKNYLRMEPDVFEDLFLLVVVIYIIYSTFVYL